MSNKTLYLLRRVPLLMVFMCQYEFIAAHPSILPLPYFLNYTVILHHTSLSNCPLEMYTVDICFVSTFAGCICLLCDGAGLQIGYNATHYQPLTMQRKVLESCSTSKFCRGIAFMLIDCHHSSDLHLTSKLRFKQRS